MATVRSMFALLAATLLLALPTVAMAQNTGKVTGTIILRQGAALPNNGVVTVQLADATQAGQPAQVIVEQIFTVSGTQTSVPFSLQYNLSQINTSHIYIVQGNIKVGGQLRYTTTTPYRVITQGNPTTITVTMNPVSLPNTSAANTLLGVVVLMMALLVGIRLLRWRLVGELGQAAHR
jgi:uncharacterized lipoprotein YbaY